MERKTVTEILTVASRNVSVRVPEEMVGKKVEVTFREMDGPEEAGQDFSEFFGIIPAHARKSLEDHAQTARDEWDKLSD